MVDTAGSFFEFPGVFCGREPKERSISVRVKSNYGDSVDAFLLKKPLKAPGGQTT
jgi:hypothetical protein